LAVLKVVVATLLGGLLFWLLWRALGAQASAPVAGKMQVAAELLDLSFDDGAVPLVRGTYGGFEVEIVPIYPRRGAASSVQVTMKEIGGLGELITETISLWRADGEAIVSFVRATVENKAHRAGLGPRSKGFRDDGWT
jgi:Na+-translocating ferredoxin:NAD+ oxidoreductase RnfG subunit